jgi:hypothetical protein
MYTPDSNIQIARLTREKANASAADSEALRRSLAEVTDLHQKVHTRTRARTTASSSCLITPLLKTSFVDSCTYYSKQAHTHKRASPKPISRKQHATFIRRTGCGAGQEERR